MLNPRLRFGIAALAMLLGLAFVLHVHRTGAIFYRSSKYVRCRECGGMQKQSELELFGILVHEHAEFRSTRLSHLLQPLAEKPCAHASGLPVLSRSLQCTAESFPWFTRSERKYDDAAGLAENESFLRAIERVSRTNLAEARVVWFTICRLDYRSSNRVARLVPDMLAQNSGSLLTLIDEKARQSE